jgi:FkbM family methyltransferase
VFAVEPNPYAFKVLLANASLNPAKTNIHPLMFAAMPEDGTFEFEYSDSGYCNGGLHAGINRWQHAHFFKLQVTGRNLVRYLRREYPEDWRRIRFIKTDTEGSDRQVIASLRELLIANRPYIKVEIYRHLPEAERMAFYRDLRDLGYRVHRFGHDEEFVGPELTGNDLMNWRHFDVFAIPEGGARQSR